MDARYLCVKNREKFQHYSKRNPPWIKLYRSVITGERDELDGFLLLTEEQQWQLVRIWVLASLCEGNLLSYDERWVRRAIRSEKKVHLEKFIRDGWLEVLSADEADAMRASADASASASKDASNQAREVVLAGALEITPVFAPPEVTENTEKKAIDSVALEDEGWESLDLVASQVQFALSLPKEVRDRAWKQTKRAGDRVSSRAAYFDRCLKTEALKLPQPESPQQRFERLSAWMRNAGALFASHADRVDELRLMGATDHDIQQIVREAA